MQQGKKILFQASTSKAGPLAIKPGSEGRPQKPAGPKVSVNMTRYVTLENVINVLTIVSTRQTEISANLRYLAQQTSARSLSLPQPSFPN